MEKRTKKEDATLSDLLMQLKITNRLLATQLRDRMRQNEMIAMLASTGATAHEIAGVLDTTPGTVKAALHRRKKKSKRVE